MVEKYKMRFTAEGIVLPYSSVEQVIHKSILVISNSKSLPLSSSPPPKTFMIDNWLYIQMAITSEFNVFICLRSSPSLPVFIFVQI